MRPLLHALRKLAKTPGFSLLSVLTLAIGIAATTAIFSVVDGVLLRPLPHPQPERLMIATHSAPGLHLDEMGISEALYLYYREHSRSFDSIALFDDDSPTLTGDGTPERLRALETTASFFEVLRASPARGRAYVEDEEHPGAEPVVVLSDELWKSRFGAAPDILGRKVQLDGVAREVVGVMPPDFRFLGRSVDLYLPRTIDPDNVQLGAFGTAAVARLADGVSREAAEADLGRLVSGLEEAFPKERAAKILLNGGFRAFVKPLRDVLVGDVRATLWILLGTVGVVLLIACANVANLFLVRAEGRQRETALRTALGATRWQLAASALAESLVLSLLAGAVGLVGAGLGVRWLIRFGPEHVPRLHEIGIDGRVLAVAAGVSLATGLVFGLLPGTFARLRDLAGMLKEGGRSATAGRERHLARHLLVGFQVALALVLLVSSGLMVRSFVHLANVAPGFRSANVLTASLWLPKSDYADDEAVEVFYRRLLDNVRALPGVESAGAMSLLPLGHSFSAQGFMIEGVPMEEGDLPPVFGVNPTTPGALAALGVPLMQGRYLELRDAEDRTGSILINESLAKSYWPGESALGKRIANGRPDDEDSDPWYTVVGVVGDVRFTGLQEEPNEMVYQPLLGKEKGEWEARSMTLVLRTQGNPMALAGAVRQAVWDLDPNLPLSRVETLDDVVHQARAPMEFTMILLAIAAAVSLALGSVGTFGIISYLVSQRTAEIGVRMALGARRADIRGMVLLQGLALAGVGAVAGLALALVVTRWLKSLLFEVRPLDPLTFVSVPLALLAVAMLACWFPASRASRIEPVVALRHE